MYASYLPTSRHRERESARERGGGAKADMAATTVTSSLSLPKPPPPPPSQKFFPLSKHQLILYSNYNITLSSHSPLFTTLSPISVSSPETETNSVVIEEEEEEEESGSSSDEEMSPNSGSLPPLTGCKACGREEIERGCNGEGRIQGGIATVPGFGWWPIKAYRPCPAYVASGGRYRRSGQSMDEVVSGRGVRDLSDGTKDGAQSRKKKQGPRRFKS